MSEGATKALAVKVVRRLRRSGHEALLAGGCVRDMLLGHRPVDYDVATSATPQQVKKLFRRVLMVGAKFGVAMVIESGRRIEVATFRSDLSYSDGRRPDGVRFVTAREDALRRDFTINGMFYDPLDRRVIDYVSGRGDLARGVVRAIGRPEQRLTEDYLRMLRAVRFAGRLGFRIDRATAEAVCRHAGLIVRISGERVREELEKMFTHPSASWSVRQMHRLGLLKAVLPELYAEERTWPAARRRVAAVGRRGDLLLTTAALLAEVPGPQLRQIARRWGASNRMRDSLVWIGEHLDDWRTLGKAPLADLKRVLAHGASETLRALWAVRERLQTGGTRRCGAIGRRIKSIDPARISPRPLVNGLDLSEMGLSEGRQVGIILAALYEDQLNERLAGRRGALRRARQLVAQAAGAQ